MKQSLKERLTKYLRNHHGWVASGELQRLVMEKTTYTPRTTVRRLEELAEEGGLEVSYRKGHAFYRSKEIPNQSMEDYFNSLPSKEVMIK